MRRTTQPRSTHYTPSSVYRVTSQQRSTSKATSVGCRRTYCCVNAVTATGSKQVATNHTLWNDEPFVGPIEVGEIEGKGRGVVTTQSVSPGELLLCCHPLGVVTGPQQERLPVEDLQVHLASIYNNNMHQWMQQLYDGTEQSTNAPVALQHSQQQQHGRMSNGSSSSSVSQDPQPAVPAVTDAVLQRLMDVVRYNAYGDLHDDLAAAAAADESAVALIGLWPEFSMLNHSCVPNAINWVLPGGNRAMVVRAAKHIPKGSEVTLSYLGAPQLLPLDGRQEALATAFGFQCRCQRCRAEEDVDGGLAELMQDIVSRVSQSFAPRLKAYQQSAAAATSRAAAAAAGTNNGNSNGDHSGADHDQQQQQQQQLQEIRRQAAAMMTLLYQQFRRQLIHPTLRQQLLSSCYCCLEIIADIDTALGDSAAAAASLSKCLEAAAAVTPGSDLHVILAAKYEAVQRESHGVESPEAAAAWQTCLSAHRLRYGVEADEGTVRQLAELNRSLYV